jgi:hypothetical protein
MPNRVHATTLAIVVMWHSAAFAQGAYVSASVLADVVLSTHTEYPGAESMAGGEAMGFALRAGTPLGARWGVEVEFVRPGEIEHEGDLGLRPLVEAGLYEFEPMVSQGNRPVDYQIVTSLLQPGLGYRVRSAERNTTLSAALWLEQRLAERFSMVYLGGVAFSRSEFESEVTYAPLILAPPSLAPIIFPPIRTNTTVYGVQPMVGVESRIEMARHAHLVPGLRMHASDGRWLVRPSVGVSWTF